MTTNRTYYILCGLCIAVIAASVTEIATTPTGRASAPPVIEKVEVERHSTVRRARLFYLRERTGKSARLKQKF